MKRKLKLGLLGNGISKTQSKKLHELIGDLYDLDVTYHLMDLGEKKYVNIKEELIRCQNEGFHGVNVTHPYKIKAFHCVQEVDKFPKGLTAVNTVMFQKDEILADNTDYLGFCDAYRDQFQDQNPGKVLMLGSGGVGLAIAFGLYTLKAEELIIYDTNEEAAKSLIEVLNTIGLKASLPKQNIAQEMQEVDGLINATPIGMHHYPGNPFPTAGFKNQKWAFDAVYTPVNTHFLQECEEHNITTISGFELFLYQGIEAFKRFSGIDIDGHLVEKEFLKKYPLQ